MFKLDENTIWEETQELRVYNLLGKNPYFTRVYREIKKDKQGWTLVEGNPIHVKSMYGDQAAIAHIIILGLNRLSDSLGIANDYHLIHLEWDPEKGYIHETT